MNEDNYLKESVIKCVDYAMEQNDETKRKIFTGLFEYTDRLVNEDILVKALNDEEKKRWFDNKMFEAQKKEIERLNKENKELKGTIEYLEDVDKDKTCIIRETNDENNRLNNIINELEKFLKINSEKDDYDLTEYNKGVNNAYNYTLDKLKELKEKK